MKFNLSCPFRAVARLGSEDVLQDPCEQDIVVHAEGGQPARGYDPPESPEITDISAPKCSHEEALMSGDWDDELWEQITSQQEEDQE